MTCFGGARMIQVQFSLFEYPLLPCESTISAGDLIWPGVVISPPQPVQTIQISILKQLYYLIILYKI